MSPTRVSSTDRNFLGCWRLRCGRAQGDACRWIYQMGLFARCADDRLVCVGIHGYIVGGKALNAKARVRAAVDE